MQLLAMVKWGILFLRCRRRTFTTTQARHGDIDAFLECFLSRLDYKLMETAKLFVNGGSQAVRLPKAFRFKGTEVYIKEISGGVLLIPKDRSIWDIWEDNLSKYDEEICPK